MRLRSRCRWLTLLGLFAAQGCGWTARPANDPAMQSPLAKGAGLWPVYERWLKPARHIDLTHTLTPSMPVWKGFAAPEFGPAINPASGQAYRYARDGFEATRYELGTDQLGTQLDPPAHWAPEFPAIDELPVTYTLRPLAVISIVDQVARDAGYRLQVADILAWEARHGRLPAGSVVMIRSDWSHRWPDPKLISASRFPGVSLAALKFLHEQRRILMHGHEPLDTDDSPNLEGEHWLMHHGYAQAEGVAHLDEVAETGCLLAMGFPKFRGGLGGYARYVGICPPDWRHGVAVGEVPEAPLPRSAMPLRWDAAQGMRVRQ